MQFVLYCPFSPSINIQFVWRHLFSLFYIVFSRPLCMSSLFVNSLCVQFVWRHLFRLYYTVFSHPLYLSSLFADMCYTGGHCIKNKEYVGATSKITSNSNHVEWPLYKEISNGQIEIGAGIAQWLERRTRDWKVAGSNPCWNGGRIFFSRVDFLCWLLFRYPFHPRVTTVARKKSRSFCQKCRWQVTAKPAYTLRMWLLLNRASALVTTCP